MSADSCAGSDTLQVTGGDDGFGDETSPDALPDADFNSKGCPCAIDCTRTGSTAGGGDVDSMVDSESDESGDAENGARANPSPGGIVIPHWSKCGFESGVESIEPRGDRR